MGSETLTTLLSKTEFAALIGVSASRVSAWIREGKLSRRELSGTGRKARIRVVAALKRLSQVLDPAQKRRAKLGPAGKVAAGDEANLAGHRARREAFQAENARLDLGVRMRTLADIDKFERLHVSVYRHFRDRLLSIAPTLADRIAAAPDAKAIATMLNQELRDALRQLAGDLDAVADGPTS